MFVFLILTASSFVAVDALCPMLCNCTIKDYIACSGASITNIAALSIPFNVTYLYIGHTQAKELTNTSFQEMPVTTRLFIEGNHFSFIESGAFQKFPFLKTLRLSNNAIRTLPSGIFHRLFYLEQLILEQNLISDLDPYTCQNLTNLKELILNRNQLTQLPSGLLDHLINLRILNLSRNKLGSLPKYIFKSLFKLRSLLLYENRLSELTSGMFDNLTELQELRLYANAIVTVDKETFYNLAKLNVLSLQKNKIKTLPEGLFLYLPSLTRLTLYENPLTELPSVLFGKMENLTELWIYRTNLITIPNFVFSNLTNLKLLVFTQNPKLRSLPKDSFRGLSNLQELSLHSNSLEFLSEGLFQDLQQLQTLSLYNNKFKDLPENLFHPLVRLENAYLNKSELMTLPVALFKSLTKLKKVSLDGNPWVCDCRLQNVKMWLEENVAIVLNSMSIFCDQPLELKGKSVLLANIPFCSYTTIQNDFHYGETTSISSTTQSIQLRGKVTLTLANLPSNHNRPTTAFVNPSYLETTHTTTSSKDDLSFTGSTTAWNNTDSSSTSLSGHIGTTHIFEDDLHTHFLRRQIARTSLNGKIIFYLSIVTATIQVVLLFVTCFILWKIMKIHSYFSSAKNPVELQRILIPITTSFEK